MKVFKYLNPRRFYYAVGRKKFLEFILLAVFMLFFYGPLMYMCIMAFGNVYEVPKIGRASCRERVSASV